MNDETSPRERWAGEFGEEWTDRNWSTVEEINEMYEKKFGITRIELLRRFLGDIDRDATVLEVGSNVGTQLKCLQTLGFDDLYGIDIQRKAVLAASRARPDLQIIMGDALNIPFEDGYFDLVFTNGVLIHVPPEQIDVALEEITRCSSEWVYGHEYYANEYTEVEYRNTESFLWKTNFPGLYASNSELELVEVEHLHHRDSENVDVEFLFRK